MNHSIVEATKATTTSPQNVEIFNAQSSLKGTQQSDGNKKWKKGVGNQNKQNTTNNAERGKKENKNVKSPYKLCKEDHFTYRFPVMEQAQKLLKQQPVGFKNHFP